VRKRRQDDYTNPRPLRFDLTDSLDTIDDWHADIQQDDIRLRHSYEVNCFLPITPSPNDLHSRICGQQGGNALSKQLLIVYDHHAQNGRG
jgi:hypothetical protein